MIIRLYNEDTDYPDVKDIHEAHYKKEFELTDFFDPHSLERIVVTDDNGDVITACNVRTIVELVALTDLERSIKERREALLRLLQAINFVSKSYSYDGFHCFPLGSKEWTDQLKLYGFNPTRGICLSKGVD